MDHIFALDLDLLDWHWNNAADCYVLLLLCIFVNFHFHDISVLVVIPRKYDVIVIIGDKRSFVGPLSFWYQLAPTGLDSY